MATSPSPDQITPGDPRYRAVVEKRFNKRFTATPDYVRFAHSTDDVVAAVADAVRENRRLVVTSGGHCLEGFVSDPKVKVIVDVSPMKAIAFDHGIWSERTAGADSPYASLWTLIELHRKQFGKIIVRGVSTAGNAAEQQTDAFLAALGDGTVAAGNRERARISWLAFALDPFPDLFAMPPGGVSAKVKDALLKKRLTDRQIGVAYDHLTSTDHDVMGGMLGLASYGGAVNSVAPDATASAQRDAILDMACNTGWLDPNDEAKNLAWVRAFYRDLFADSGGVPVPGDAYAGTFINHPDVDLADPALNTSGVPWHTLYFRDG